MKPILLLIVVLATSLLATNCNLREKEKAALLQAQQAKDDSIRQAEVSQVKQTEARKSSLTDSLNSYNTLQGRLQSALIQTRASLYTAKDQMTQIRAFHLGRMPNDREQQIRKQEVTIQSLALEQANIQTALQITQAKINRTKIELSELQ